MNDNKMVLAVVAVVAVVAVGAFVMLNRQPAIEESSMTTTTNTMEKDTMAPSKAADSMEKGVLVGGAMMVQSKDIVDNAVMSKDHTTLVAAVQAGGLVETLKGTGPFTVFAPTNVAFTKLPVGTVDTLLMPENKAKLVGVLTYHVVPGAIRSTDLKDGMKAKTVNGQELTFNFKEGYWWINGTSMVTIADVISSNGVTHVVDTVLLPK